MPVLVSAADGALGRALVLALLGQGGEVRAYASGDGETGDLRAAGAIVATGDLDDEGRLDAAMTDAHTVVHAVLPWLAPSTDRYAADARTVLGAARAADVRRVIVVSVPGADADHRDPLRRVCGEIEQVAAQAGLPTIAVRSSLVDLPILRNLLASAPLEPAQREVPVAPVRLDDLVAGLVALDAARSTAAVGHAVFRADGPRSSLAGYLAAIGASRDDLVGRTYLSSDRAPLLLPALSDSWVNDEDDGADLWTFADLRPRAVGP